MPNIDDLMGAFPPGAQPSVSDLVPNAPPSDPTPPSIQVFVMPEFPVFKPSDWYWHVAGDTTRAWSSKLGQYVPAVDVPADAHPTAIASEAELADVLAGYGLKKPTVTADDVVAERARRLALGFDFDFGDARGVHRFGTTPQDMIGWDVVSKLASAAVAIGNGAAPINIVTDTGPVTVSALEWQQILLFAGVAQQPIWLASFALQAMSPIPADYANDSYWR